MESGGSDARPKVFVLLAGLWLVCGLAPTGLAPLGQAGADVVIERWAVGTQAAHPESVKVVEAGDGSSVIQVDLGALPGKKPQVYRVRLLAQRQPVTGADEEALTAVEVFALTAPFSPGKPPVTSKEPLKLIPPWYDAFDATGAVRDALAGKAPCQFHVKAFPKWRQETTELEIAYEGTASKKPPASPGGVEARHHAGQTFITWKELDDPFGDKPVALGILREKQTELDQARRVRYLVFRHDRPIDAKSLPQAELLGEVAPLSAYNVRGVSVDRLIYKHQLRAIEDALFARKIAGGPFRGYHPGMPEMAEVDVQRLAIPAAGEESKVLPPGTGLYVHHPAQAGKGYYAVLCLVDGLASADLKSAAAAPVDEQVGTGEPVFQCTEDLKVFYDYPGERRRYVQWCAPPLSNLPNQYFNWGVYVPPAAKGDQPLALGIHFHDWQGLYIRPRWPHPADMLLLAPHDAPWGSYGYGYHESLGTLRSFREGAVRDYTARRVDAFVEWACRAFRIDRNRMSTHGLGTLGGTAALHYALRQPTRFAFVIAGHFDADPKSTPAIVAMDSNRVKTHLPSLEAVWGKKDWDLKNAEGQSIWKDRDLVDLIQRSEKVALPFLSLGTGSQHTTWPQENALMKAMLATRQAFWTDFTWGGQAPRFGPLYVRRDKPILALCPAESYLAGQNWYKDARWQKASMGYWGGGEINGGLSWSTADVVDQPDRLEITARASGNVTIRNCQAFKPAPGQKVRWETKTASRDRDRSGVVEVDSLGLVTLPGIDGRLTLTLADAATTREQPAKEGIGK